MSLDPEDRLVVAACLFCFVAMLGVLTIPG